MVMKNAVVVTLIDGTLYIVSKHLEKYLDEIRVAITMT